MIGGILFRMILWDLTKVFVMSLVGITGILLLAGIVAEASQQGLSPEQILAAIPLLIPSTLPYTIPATTLFATCVVYGRLAADNEILAIKSAGINLIHVVSPALVLGVTMSVVTMGLYFNVIPYTHLLLRQLVLNDAEELLYSVLRKQKVISHPKMPYSLWVRNVQGKRLLNPVIKQRDPDGKTAVVAAGREGEIRVDMNQQLLLVKLVNSVAIMPDGSRSEIDARRVWEIPLPDIEDTARGSRRPRDMVWMELYGRRAELLREVAAVENEAKFTREEAARQNNPAMLEHARNLDQRKKFLLSQVLAVDVEIYMRPALSVGCFFFILVGCPVGIWFSRSDYLSSFITCFLPIVFLYYPLMLCGTGLAKEGRFEPITLIWGANALMALIGGFLYWRLTRN